MRKLIVFNHVTLDGYFVDGNSSMTWAKTNQNDPEWSAFVAENSSGEGPLVFGRITYELMAGYWPTPMAKEHTGALAERMNRLPKVVFSRTMDQAAWSNTRLVKNDLAGEIRKMKKESGDGIAILGSGSLVSQLSTDGLIDEFHFAVNPIVLGQGRTMFEDVKNKLDLKLLRSRAFQNGNVVLVYAPAT
jgi:dihydrofolate reductase